MEPVQPAGPAPSFLTALQSVGSRIESLGTPKICCVSVAESSQVNHRLLFRFTIPGIIDAPNFSQTLSGFCTKIGSFVMRRTTSAGATLSFLAVCSVFSAISTASFAQQRPGSSAPQHTGDYQERKKEANESVVTIMGSGTASPYTLFAEDIQNVVDEPDVPNGLRVLPILGRGGAQSALDVLLLKGVDMGVIEADDVNAARKKEPLVFASAETRLHYITKLSNSEFQILARKDIASLKDLEGKKVSCFKALSSTGLACDKIFKMLGLNIQPLHLDQEEASAKLKSGEIDAFARYAGAPHGAFKGFKAEEGFHFLPIDGQSVSPEKFGDLIGTYSPALLKTEYYPQLIAPDKAVPTIAGSTLLVVYNWPAGGDRYNRVTKFINKFFDNIARFQGPGRQPKWAEINIAAEVPGWTRFGPAQAWLDAHKQADGGGGANTPVRAAFEEFIKARHKPGETISKEQRDALFAQFMTWWSSQKTVARQ